MQYTQRNPLPLPKGRTGLRIGAGDHGNGLPTGKYALEKQNLLNLYEKGKALAWERHRPRLVDRRQHRAHGQGAGRQRQCRRS